MTPKFNKSVLASAIAAAALIAGSASAADLQYNSPVQITYAKDLFATDSRTIDLPAGFTVRAINTAELTTVTNVAVGDVVEIVISLGYGPYSARFQSAAPTMSETALRSTIMIGGQLNGGVAASVGSIDPAASITYSQGEREMRIRFKTTAVGNGTALPSPLTGAENYSFRLPSLRTYDLQGALLESNIVQGGMSITNITKTQQILAGNATLARSVWGERAAFSVAGVTPNKWIDVQRCSATANPRVWFTPANAIAANTVGQSCTVLPGRNWFNAGQIDVAIQTAALAGIGAGGVPATRVNNFDGSTGWGLSSTVITYTVTGENLTGFNGTGGNNSMWLDTAAACSRASGQFLNLSVNAAGTAASVSYNMAAPVVLGTHFLPLTNSATAVPMHVCFSANGTSQLVPQVLNAEVAFNHGVPALFVDPPKFSGALFPLRTNVGVIMFQNVNPGGNTTAQSFLRLTNNNAVACDVSIVAKDDAGKFAGPVKYTMAAHASEQFNIDVLETGVDNRGRAITGKFGDGTGKWYVRVEPECARLDASALNRNSIDGTVTDLTPQKGETFDNRGAGPLLP